MDDMDGGESGQDEASSPTRFQASTSGVAAAAPIPTRGHGRTATGRTAPAIPYALQRTMTADLARQHSAGPPGVPPFGGHPSGVPPLRHISSAGSDARLQLQGQSSALRRTASAGDFPSVLVESDVERGSEVLQGRSGGGVLGKLMGRVGAGSRQAARLKELRAFGGPPGVSKFRDIVRKI